MHPKVSKVGKPEVFEDGVLGRPRFGPSTRRINVQYIPNPRGEGAAEFRVGGRDTLLSTSISILTGVF